MAEVRDFNSYKKKRFAGKAGKVSQTAVVEKADAPAERKEDKINTDSEAYQKRKKRIRLIAVAVVIIILAVISFFSWRDKQYTEALIAGSVNIVDSMEATCMNLEGNIFQYSRDGMSLIDAKGEAVWNQTYEMQTPIVKTCGDVVAIGDYNGRTIYVSNTSSPMGRIQTDLPIRDFSVASQGVVAVILDDASVTWIYLYDKEGNILASFRTTMGDSGYPLSAAISPSGQLVCVSFLTVDAAKTKTNIAFYNFGNVGKNKTDNFVGGFIFDNNVVPQVRFIDDAHSYAIATDRIMFFSGNEIPQMDKQILLGDEDILSVWDSDEYVAILFAGGSDKGNFRLQVFDKSGNEMFKKYMDKEYGDILFAGRQIVLYNADSWKIIGTDGTDRYEGTFDYSVRAVIPTNVSGRYLLVGPDRIDTVELR